MVNLYRFEAFEKYPSLLHAVTTKSERLPYSFSLALHTGENKEQIIANRKRFAKSLGVNRALNFIVANQTHSDHISIIEESTTKGWEDVTDAIEECDALITKLPHVVLTILTADCVPVLLYDPVKKVVGAVHAGWKGTHMQITSKTVHNMISHYGCHASDIIAGVAPSIKKCCYEVGEDVAKHFLAYEDAYEKKNNGKYMLDLQIINKAQLIEAGIVEKNIDMSNICTACDVDTYFSYRKEKGCSGRFMSTISLIEPSE